MISNKKASSLLVGFGLTLLISLVAITILDYMVPFAKNTKNIENSIAAYYNAYGGIEHALYIENKLNIGEDYTYGGSGNESYSIQLTASGGKLPMPGNGNSEFHEDWNRIKVGEPIQLFLNHNLLSYNDVANLVFYFRVPNVDLDDLTGEQLDGGNMDVIAWSLSSESDTITSMSGSHIKASEICNSKGSCNFGIDLYSKQGRNLEGLDSGDQKFQKFYQDQCSEQCILKFIITNKLKTINYDTIPYIEWFALTSGSSIPLRYSYISIDGKSYGFVKKLQLRVPQQTVSDAFDRTIFQ